MKRVSIFIFMAADNNLYLSSIRDLREMEQVGSSNDVNIVVEVDRRKAFTFEDEPQITELHTKRLYIEKGQSKELADLGETNTGDYRALKKFLEWGIETYPAERYFVILWNHGGGVKDEDVYNKFHARMKRPIFGSATEGVEVRWILGDDTSRDYLDMIELKKALSIGKKLELVGFDACLMSMFEVIYQLRDIAHFCIGSQEVEPPDGWPYHDILSFITQYPESLTRKITSHIVSVYINHFESTSEKVTQSAVRTGDIEEIAQQVDALAERLLSTFDKSELELSRILRTVQKYREQDYVDLYHFAELCESKIDDVIVRETAKKLMSTIADTTVSNAHTGAYLEHSHGISILFPGYKLKDEEEKLYQQLDFSQKYPNWFKLITRYVSAQ